MKKIFLTASALCMLCGCGGGEPAKPAAEPAKPTVITPVDNIKQQIDIKDDLKASIKDSANQNSETQKELDKKK